MSDEEKKEKSTDVVFFFIVPLLHRTLYSAKCVFVSTHKYCRLRKHNSFLDKNENDSNDNNTFAHRNRDKKKHQENKHTSADETDYIFPFSFFLAFSSARHICFVCCLIYITCLPQRTL